MDNLPVKIFQKEQFGKVRVILKDGEPWFVAKDVCDCLRLENSRKAVSDLDEDEKGVTISDTLGGKQEMSTVSESGLYSLIFKSRKPEAKAFKRWVTHEVLPAINATRSYSLDDKKALPELDTKLRAADVIASVLYKDTNQRVLFLDKIYLADTGQSALALAGVTLVAPAERQLFTPTEIGTWYHTSARIINAMLKDFGLQKRMSNKWEPTEEGIKFGAVMFDTGKAHSDGTPVRQLKWDSQIKDFLDTRIIVPTNLV